MNPIERATVLHYRGQAAARVQPAGRSGLPEHPLLVGHDIDDVAAFCRKLAPRVVIVRNYAPDDATLLVWRSPT